jgi:hypothetical protein
MQGELELSQDIVENTYTCLTCKRCGVACLRLDENKQPAINECNITQALRYEIVKAGMEPEALKQIDKTIEDSHNPLVLILQRGLHGQTGSIFPPKERSYTSQDAMALTAILSWRNGLLLSSKPAESTLHTLAKMNGAAAFLSSVMEILRLQKDYPA